MDIWLRRRGVTTPWSVCKKVWTAKANTGLHYEFKKVYVVTCPTALRAVIKTKEGTILSLLHRKYQYCMNMFPGMIMHIAYSTKPVEPLWN